MSDKNNIHRKFMLRCIELAKKGIGKTYPNPLVGCVIVNENKIISEGWHKRAGENHAEINALLKIKNVEVLEKSTLYVNLEPCCHFGKTGPCVNKIIEMKIPRVVIGCLDYSKKNNGEGVKILKKKGVKVKVNILKDVCINLNKRFFTYELKKRPYIIIKWAESFDGYFSPTKENRTKNRPYWISSLKSRKLAHLWRSHEESILIGVQTANDDNPKLTNRYYKGNNPIRIILDPNNRINKKLEILNDNNKTIIFTKSKELNLKNKFWIKINYKSSIKSLTDKLYKLGIQSLIVEGGKKTIEGFLNENIFDEIRVVKSKKLLLNGTKSPEFKYSLKQEYKLGEDLVRIYSSNNKII